jgi:hypothetical protein
MANFVRDTHPAGTKKGPSVQSCMSQIGIELSLSIIKIIDNVGPFVPPHDWFIRNSDDVNYLSHSLVHRLLSGRVYNKDGPMENALIKPFDHPEAVATNVMQIFMLIFALNALEYGRLNPKFRLKLSGNWDDFGPENRHDSFIIRQLRIASNGPNDESPLVSNLAPYSIKAVLTEYEAIILPDSQEKPIARQEEICIDHLILSFVCGIDRDEEHGNWIRDTMMEAISFHGPDPFIWAWKTLDLTDKSQMKCFWTEKFGYLGEKECELPNVVDWSFAEDHVYSDTREQAVKRSIMTIEQKRKEPPTDNSPSASKKTKSSNSSNSSYEESDSSEEEESDMESSKDQESNSQAGEEDSSDIESDDDQESDSEAGEEDTSVDRKGHQNKHKSKESIAKDKVKKEIREARRSLLNPSVSKKSTAVSTKKNSNRMPKTASSLVPNVTKQQMNFLKKNHDSHRPYKALIPYVDTCIDELEQQLAIMKFLRKYLEQKQLERQGTWSALEKEFKKFQLKAMQDGVNKSLQDNSKDDDSNSTNDRNNETDGDNEGKNLNG